MLCGWFLRKKKFRKKKTSCALHLLLLCEAAGRLKQLNLNTQAQSVCS
jgi:hypothetical protein